jgi:hypothetical protein
MRTRSVIMILLVASVLTGMAGLLTRQGMGRQTTDRKLTLQSTRMVILMFIARPISFWGAGRWQLIRTGVRKSFTTFMHRLELSPPIARAKGSPMVRYS